MPGERQGCITPELHNRGGWQDRSQFTSWTFSLEVAKRYASEESGGIVLRLPYEEERPSPKLHARQGWRWVTSPDHYDEAEVLLEGVRIDAEVVWHG